MLLQQIMRLNCERCRLRTEHYVQIWNGVVLMSHCLKCGQMRTNPDLTKEELQSYPPDDRKPVYVS